MKRKDAGEARRRRLPPEGHRRDDRERLVPHRGHGDRAVLDEDARRGGARARRRSGLARRRRGAEGAPPPGAGAARDAAQPRAPAQHGGGDRDGRRSCSRRCRRSTRKPKSLDELVAHSVARVLDLFGVHSAKLARWQGMKGTPARARLKASACSMLAMCARLRDHHQLRPRHVLADVARSRRRARPARR